MSDYVTKTNVLSALGRFMENADNLYETKADASDLKDSIDANSKRITNLEQKAGDEIVVDYPSSTYGMDEVPPNVAEYGKASKLRGVTRAWNQLVQNGNFASGDGWVLESGVTASFSGNVATISSTIENNGIRRSVDFITGHKYLVSADVSTESAITVGLGSNSSSGVQLSFTPSVFNQFINHCDVFTALNDYYTFFIFATSPYSNLKVRNVTLYDLTLIFGAGNEPATVADALAQIPALGQYNAYDAGSLVSTTYSAVKSGYKYNSAYKWRNGYYNSAGQYASNIDTICTIEGGFPITNGQNIVATSDTPCEIDFNIYDANGTQLTYKQIANVSTSNMTAVANSAFVNVSFRGSGITASNIKITIGGNDSVVLDTLTLPSPVTLKGAGAVADTDELNVEVDGVERRRQTRRVGQVDGGTLNWQTGSTATSGKYRFTASLPIAINQNSNIAANILCPRYIALSPLQTYRCVTGVSNNNNSSQIIVYDESYAEKSVSEFKEHVTGLIFNYELANPIVTLLDPIPDPFIQVEGGGTIRPIQSQTTEIDSAMTAEYLSLGANA